MQPKAIVHLTLVENFKGQIFWVAAAVGVVCLALAAILSGAALTTEAWLFDSTSYFLSDVTLFLTAALLGSFLFAKDFSNRGLAEIILVRGMNREQLLFYRLFAHCLSLLLLSLLMVLSRSIAFILPTEPAHSTFLATFYMFAFTTLKAWVACALATFLGIHTRPVIAFLGTTALFAFGHFATGISGITGIIDAENSPISAKVSFLLKIFRVWNPNSLVLESFQGHWNLPTGPNLFYSLMWGIGACMVFICAGFLSVRNRDIGSMKI